MRRAFPGVEIRIERDDDCEDCVTLLRWRIVAYGEGQREVLRHTITKLGAKWLLWRAERHGLGGRVI